MAEARARVVELLADLPGRLGVAPERVALGGFSQGAMLSTDVALHFEGPLGALLVFSGTLVSEATWAERAPRRAGLPVLIAHGRRDALLPFSGAERLRALLEGAGLDVTFVPFDGGHTMGAEPLARAGALLRRRLPATAR